VLAAGGCALLLIVFPSAPALADPALLQVCAADRTWQRPTPEEMARTAWRDNRYVMRSAAGVDVWPVLVPYYIQHFLLFTLFSSGMSHAEDLTGLMPAHPAICAGSDDLQRSAAVEIWSIGYHVDHALVTADTLMVTVEPNGTASTGYEIAQTPRPPQEPWTARFVLADGTEVAAASPVHEVVATAVDDQVPDAGLPDGLPRPEEGHSVLDGAGSTIVDSAGRLTYARYLVLVPDGTTPSDEADTYRAIVTGAGFATSGPTTNADGSASFSIDASPNGDLGSGKVLVQQAMVPPIDGALTVSLTITYPLS